MFKRIQIWLLLVLFPIGFMSGCESDVTNRVGVSSSSFVVAIKGIAGNSGLPADGTSQATIRVEVFTTSGQLVNDEQIFLTTTLGTLEDLTLTTANGVATTRLTSGTAPGTAFVVATVENVSATTAIQIVNINGTVT